jgi:hypothetical protein
MTPLRLAALLAALAAVAAWQVTVIPQSAIEMTVGATLVPGVAVALLAWQRGRTRRAATAA